MDETGWHYAKWNKPNRETKTASHMVPLICAIQKKKKKNIDGSEGNRERLVKMYKLLVARWIRSENPM